MVKKKKKMLLTSSRLKKEISNGSMKFSMGFTFTLRLLCMCMSLNVTCVTVCKQLILHYYHEPWDIHIFELCQIDRSECRFYNKLFYNLKSYY